MCKCNPSIRTPFCGKINCEWPEPDENDFDEKEKEFDKAIAVLACALKILEEKRNQGGLLDQFMHQTKIEGLRFAIQCLDEVQK